MVYNPHSELAKVEKTAKRVCKLQQITLVSTPFYMSFARELFHIRNDPKDTKKHEHARKAFDKWLLRGLESSILIYLMVDQGFKVTTRLEIIVEG